MGRAGYRDEGGLFRDEQEAQRTARELAARGHQVTVADGGEAETALMLRRVVRGASLGLLIGAGIGILLGSGVKVWHPAGAGNLNVAMAVIALTIAAAGMVLGGLFGALRAGLGDRSTLVATPVRDPEDARATSAVIHEHGGTETEPLVPRDMPAQQIPPRR